MAWRLYFLFGDLAACVTAGGASGWLTLFATPDGWPALAAIGVGMIAGMLVAMVVGLVFTPLFGSLEVMLPSSLAGMAGGMTVGMIGAIAGIGYAEAAWGGGLVGILCLAVTRLQDFRLRGEAT